VMATSWWFESTHPHFKLENNKGTSSNAACPCCFSVCYHQTSSVTHARHH
jgi:hypothetical protein